MPHFENASLSGEAGARVARRLLLHAREQGFFAFGLLCKEEWERVLAEHGPAHLEGMDAARDSREISESRNFNAADGIEEGAETRMKSVRRRYNLETSGAMLVVALRYSSHGKSQENGERLAVPEAGKPIAKIGRFARAHWYREIVQRLSICAQQTIVDMEAIGVPMQAQKQWHRFANSRFPEKALAHAAGMGTFGRNSLFIAQRPEGSTPRIVSNSRPDRWSSAILLGGMLLPFDLEHEIASENRVAFPPLVLCKSCTRCVDACPTNAIEGGGSFAIVRERCIQNYTASERELPPFIENAWRDQLYGCDICLEACPYFILDSHGSCSIGALGQGFDAAAFAALDDSRLRTFLRGSALDQKWISCEALRRNARFALRSRL